MCAVIGHPLVRKSCSVLLAFALALQISLRNLRIIAVPFAATTFTNPLDWYFVRSHGPTNAFLVACGGELGTVWELPWRRGICNCESSEKSEVRYPHGEDLKPWSSGKHMNYVSVNFRSAVQICCEIAVYDVVRLIRVKCWASDLHSCSFLFLSSAKWGKKKEKKGKEKHSDASLEVSVTFLRWQVVLDCRLFRKLVLRFCFRCRCCFLASGVAGSIVWFFDGSVLVVEWLRVLCTF